MRLYHFTTGGSAELLRKTGRFYSQSTSHSWTGTVLGEGVDFSDSTDTDAYSPDSPWLVCIEIEEPRISRYEMPRTPTARRLLGALSMGRRQREWLIPHEVLRDHARVVAIRHISQKHNQAETRDSDEATVDDQDQRALIAAVQEMLTAETAALVDSGAATLEIDEEWAELQPITTGACEITVTVESDTEVQLVLSPPGDELNAGVVLRDNDREALVETVRDHLLTALDGRVVFTFKTGWSSGRLRFQLADGQTRDHFNNVFLKPLVGRGEGWETFRPPGYRAE